MVNSMDCEIDGVLRQIGEIFGAPLCFDDNRVVTVECGGNIFCSIEAPRSAEHVYFHLPVRHIEKQGHGKHGHEGVLRECLRLNLFMIALPGAALALDETSDELVLCYAAPAANLDADLLAGLIAKLVDVVADLRLSLSGRDAREIPSGDRPPGSFLIRA